MNNLCQCPFPYCGDIASLKFINRDTISYTCLRNHKTSKEVKEIRKYNTKSKSNSNNDDKNNNFSFCKEHNKQFLYYCKSCKINFCYSCKEKHDTHKYIYLVDFIPSNNTTNSLEKYINDQKNEIKKISELFNELINNLKNQFDAIINSLYDYLICEETILSFSLNNIYHINSIENIKYIFDINFFKFQNGNKINYNLSKIKFDYSLVKDGINNKPIFTQIEYIYKYLSDIFVSSQIENNNNKNINDSFIVLYKKPFIENIKNLEKINRHEQEKIKSKIKDIKFELQQYKILNEHEQEIRNIISFNNGFFGSSSLDIFKIFNSLTGECVLSMKEPYDDQICYILKINSNNNFNNEETNILLLSRHLIFIRFNNSYYYENKTTDINDFEERNSFEIIQSIDNNGIYISQGIQLTNSDIIVYDDNNKIKIYKLNPKTQTYLLMYYNINFSDLEFCSFLEIKPNIFVASSNENLEKGENVIKVFDTNEKEIYTNDNKTITIKNINCSTGRDSLCMIKKNKLLAVGLQQFNKDKSNKNINLVNGIGIVDAINYQIIQIIEDYRVHSMCTISLYINYDMLNKDNIFKKENFYTKRKILVTAGYDREKEIRLIKFFEIVQIDNDDKSKYRFIDLINRNEIISQHEGFINSLKWLENGILVSGSSDKMIFLYNDINLNKNIFK